LTSNLIDGMASLRSGDADVIPHCHRRRPAIAKTGAFTFAPGQTTKTITIEVNYDSTKKTN